MTLSFKVVGNADLNVGPDPVYAGVLDYSRDVDAYDKWENVSKNGVMDVKPIDNVAKKSRAEKKDAAPKKDALSKKSGDKTNARGKSGDKTNAPKKSGDKTNARGKSGDKNRSKNSDDKNTPNNNDPTHVTAEISEEMERSSASLRAIFSQYCNVYDRDPVSGIRLDRFSKTGRDSRYVKARERALWIPAVQAKWNTSKEEENNLSESAVGAKWNMSKKEENIYYLSESAVDTSGKVVLELNGIRVRRRKTFII
jgi:hypothetical protein